MKNVQILLRSLEDIKEFNRITCSYSDLPVDVSSGEYTVDAKSLIGLFSIDTDKKLDLKINSDNYNDYLMKISKFLA